MKQPCLGSARQRKTLHFYGGGVGKRPDYEQEKEFDMAKKRTIAGKTKKKGIPVSKTYERLWRHKYLTADATSLQEMARIFRSAAIELEQMVKAGVILAKDSDMAGDCAWLTTTNPKVAQTFGFEDEDGADLN